MVTQTRNEFLTNRAWHRAVIGGSDMILRRTSALTHLQLFNGYMREKRIDVYSKTRGNYENINYHVVENYSGIDYVQIGDVYGTSVSQTINDMLADESSDELALVEGLSSYYFSNGENFDGLHIKPENMERFNSIKDWAAEYYDEV